jgi:hypothetical protein
MNVDTGVRNRCDRASATNHNLFWQKARLLVGFLIFWLGMNEHPAEVPK